MHVLVTEAHFGASERITQRLRDLGAQVSTCHDRVGFCRALQPGGRCPLDVACDPVDLVVDVRGAGEELTAREYGVVCGVRAMRAVMAVPADPGAPVVVPPVLRGRVEGASEEQLVAVCRHGMQTLDAARAGWAGWPAHDPVSDLQLQGQP